MWHFKTCSFQDTPNVPFLQQEESGLVTKGLHANKQPMLISDKFTSIQPPCIERHKHLRLQVLLTSTATGFLEREKLHSQRNEHRLQFDMAVSGRWELRAQRMEASRVLKGLQVPAASSGCPSWERLLLLYSVF